MTPDRTQTTSPPAPATPTDGASPADMALATVRDVTSELVRLVRETAAHATDGWSLASVARSLSPALEQAFAEHEALGREVADLRTRLADLEALLATREAGWRAERAVLETELAREQERAQAGHEEGERRRKEIELLAARERRVREQMETVAARANADREETLRLARDMVQSAEEARFAVVEEMETLRAALAAEQARIVEIQHERARVSQGAAERDAELARAQHAIEQLEASRANGAAELARDRATLARTRKELLAVQHEYQLAQVQIEKLCAAHDDMVEDRAHLGAKLHDAKEREARLQLRIIRLEHRIKDATGVAGEPIAEPPDAEPEHATSQLATELSRAEERTHALERELAAAKAAAIAATARIADLQAEARAAEVARATIESEAATLRARLDDAAAPPAAPAPGDETRAVETASIEIASSPDDDGDAPFVADAERPLVPTLPIVADDDVLELEPLVAEDEMQTLEVDADDLAPEPTADAGHAEADETAVEPLADATADAPPSPAMPAEPVAAPRTLTVLDAADAWASIGVDAAILPPAPETVERARELTADVLVLNLATPGVLATAAAIRAAGIAVPFQACALPADADLAWPLGAFDVVVRPVDPEAVRRQIAALVPPGGNVIMVSSESATQIPLRQGLLQAGLSVRTAWDRKQAVALADAVRPDVVVVDLAAAGAPDLVVDLGTRAPSPRIVLVPGTPAQIEEFETALTARARTAGTVDRSTLLATAASR